MSNNLRLIPEGEKFSASETIDPNNPDVVTYVYAVRRTRNGPRYEKRTVADYSKCTREDLIRLAAYDVKVWAQGNLRNAGDSMISNPTLYAHVDVKADRINATRQPVDPEQRFIRAGAAMGFSEAEVKAMLEAKKAAAAAAAAETAEPSEEPSDAEADAESEELN